MTSMSKDFDAQAQTHDDSTNTQELIQATYNVFAKETLPDLNLTDKAFKLAYQFQNETLQIAALSYIRASLPYYTMPLRGQTRALARTLNNRASDGISRQCSFLLDELFHGKRESTPYRIGEIDYSESVSREAETKADTSTRHSCPS